ncbi:MAG: L,D-transpeptidase family protein [Allosphingosinicella sp.]|uniref:L,D-transpeptidase family protein n=1 Tax=Allosphingosinicella sp. TaxID=2823234 RepID=UPI00393D7C77
MIQFALKSLMSLAAVAILAAPVTLPAEGTGQPPRLAYADVSGVEAVPPGHVARAPARDTRPIDVRDLRIVRELPIQNWLRPGEYAWDDEAARTATGEAIVVVNLRARVLSVYKNGVEIGRSSILYGAPDKPTPTGTFPILEKRRDHTSNIYNAPMPHMQRLTWDGVALHGSPHLADDFATNGCIGLPREFAALLFEVTRVGDRVVVWSGRAES